MTQLSMKEWIARQRYRSERQSRMYPRFKEELYDKGIHPDMVMDSLDRYVLCTRDVKFIWDQWMKCVITCRHGEFAGVSFGMENPMGQSMSSAFEKFQLADHDMCVDDEHQCWEDDRYDENDMTIAVCPVCGLTANGEKCAIDSKFCYGNV